MAESNELKKIKKMYGENFMKLCRSLFPTLLETEGRLYEILSLCFSENCKTLYDDIINNQLEEEFKKYIYSKIDVEDSEKKIIVNKTPYELLEEAGYDLIECTTEEEIQSFKKYYTPREELCTFNGGRLDRCVVFFAVRKDVESIKREDFQKPKREDEYGTSVLGIQFDKQGMCTVSIKNRYNHTVNNPDATYGNDLDKIAYGLTRSFGELLRQKGLELSSTNIEKFEIPGYVVAGDGKYYKYNMEINGIYYCPGNIIIENGQARKLENPEKQVLIDYFILDAEKKTLQAYDPIRKDSFIDTFEQLERIEIRKDKERGNGRRTITIRKKGQEEPIIVEIDKDNQIVGYKNEGLTQVGECFLEENKGLTELELPSLVQVGDNFLHHNKGLAELELPSLIQVGDEFLFKNEELAELKLPNLIQVGDGFLFKNEELAELKLPNLTQVGDCFLEVNKGLTELELPSLVQVGANFLHHNKGLTELELPSLVQVGDEFLFKNEELAELKLPNLTQVGDCFLFKNEELAELKLPNLTQVGDGFLEENKGLTELELPSLTQVKDYFLYRNKGLTELELPSLVQVGDSFLHHNKGLTELELPSLVQVGDGFLHHNKKLTELELPSLTQVGKYFLNNNPGLKKLYLPKLPELRDIFSDIIDKNQKRQETETHEAIDAKSIADLDKASELTTSEIHQAGEILRTPVENEKNERSD